MKLSIIFNSAVEKAMLSRGKCKLVFVYCLNFTRELPLHNMVSFPQWRNYFLQPQDVLLHISFCNIHSRN